jgi:hypothetical protein
MTTYPQPKQFALDILARLPDDANFERIREECNLIVSLLESYEDEKAGRLIPHEQVVAEFKEWISKSAGRREPTAI